MNPIKKQQLGKMAASLIAGMAALAILAAAPASCAADAIMIANDAIGTSSFNTAGNWSPAGAPSAGNNYSTKGYLLRSPNVAGSYTFAGDSLTLGGPAPHYPFLTDGTVNNNSLIFLASGISLTVYDLILDASYIRDGLATNQTCSMNGNITVTSNGGGFAAQCATYIDSVVKGSGTLYIADNGSGEAVRTIYFTSGSNTYDGSIKLLALHATSVTPPPSSYSRWALDSTGLMNFTPTTNGVCNIITGTGTATLDGIFNFNLGDADNTLGDSWTIVNTTVKTFNPSFTVSGFTDVGGDLWNTDANDVTYQFSESTGTLTVIPEPATWIMLVSGAMGIAFYVRRKK